GRGREEDSNEVHSEWKRNGRRKPGQITVWHHPKRHARSREKCGETQLYSSTGVRGPCSCALATPVFCACISAKSRARRGDCRNPVPVLSHLRSLGRPSMVERPISEIESVQCPVQPDHRQLAGSVSPWPFPSAAARCRNGGRGYRANQRTVDSRRI